MRTGSRRPRRWRTTGRRRPAVDQEDAAHRSAMNLRPGPHDNCGKSADIGKVKGSTLRGLASSTWKGMTMKLTCIQLDWAANPLRRVSRTDWETGVWNTVRKIASTRTGRV